VDTKRIQERLERLQDKLRHEILGIEERGELADQVRKLEAKTEKTAGRA
jgi:hypothetical protein